MAAKEERNGERGLNVLMAEGQLGMKLHGGKINERDDGRHWRWSSFGMSGVSGV